MVSEHIFENRYDMGSNCHNTQMDGVNWEYNGADVIGDVAWAGELPGPGKRGGDDVWAKKNPGKLPSGII